MDDAPDQFVRARDRERWLSVLWAPAAARPALFAIHALDLEQARVVADVSEPMLAEVRLAWWREQVQALGKGAPAPPQPLLAALATEALARRVNLVALADIEEGHLPHLLEGAKDVAAIAAARGGPLFVALQTAIDGEPPADAQRPALLAAGALWARARLWRDHGLFDGAGRAEGLRRIAPALRGLVVLADGDLRDAAKGREPGRVANPVRQLRMALAVL